MSGKQEFSRKLLEPGWAGSVSDEEAEYIAEKLNNSERLRKVWQRGKQRKHSKVSADMVRKMIEEDYYGRERRTYKSV